MTGRVFHETLHDGLGQEIAVDEVLFESDTGHQKLVIFTEHRDTLNYLERQISSLLGR